MNGNDSNISHIGNIRLSRMLPHVFKDERIPASEVWLQEVEFRRGESTLVEATSGAGKSSMCAYIYGARTDYEGDLRFDNIAASSLTIPHWQSMRRVNLAYLPQELALFPELTALENIRLKNRLTGHASDDMIARWMDALGISFRADTPCGRMSIGQQQRVAIVRALCQPFDFLLLDEPVSHLDEENNRIAARIIAEEASRQGAGIISTSVGNHLLLDYSRILKL